MQSARIRLEDISDAIAGIEQTLAGVKLAQFSNSRQMQRAVERGLEIISEASRAIAKDQKAAQAAVPWNQIAGIGNTLRHEYHRVEPAIIRNITRFHLPALSLAVNAMLDEME